MENKDIPAAKEPIGFVFIHGAGLHSQIWDETVQELKNPYLLVDFPHRKHTKQVKELTLQEYIHHINKQIEAWEVKKFIIVAHSIGGVLALKVASLFSDRVVGFVAVGAAIPEQGHSFLSVMPFAKRMLMRVLLRMLGTRPPEPAIRQGLCNDLTPEQAAVIVRDFVPESIRLYTDRTEAGAPQTPKLYLMLAQDQEFNLAMQHTMAGNLAPHYTETLQSGHLPMISKPKELRQALQAFLSHPEVV